MNFKQKTKLLRLTRLILPLLCALGGVLAVVGLVRTAALASSTEVGAERSLSPLQPLNGGIDLSITKTHATRFFVGDVGTYTISVKNVGSPINPPYTVKITDTLPIPPLAFADYKGNGWNCSVVTPTVGCQYGITQTLNTNDFLPPLNIVVKLKPSTVQTVTNTVAISDTAGTNNLFSDPTNISTNLTITKSAFPTIVTPTRVVTFTLQVKNNGPNDTTNVKVTDTLPSIFTFNGAKPSGEYNPTTGLWSIGNLAENQTKTLIITATVKDGACGQVYTNTVQNLTSDLPDPNLTDNRASAAVTVRNTCVVGQVVRSDNVTIPIPNAKVQIKDSANHIYTTTTSSLGVFTFTNSTVQPLTAGVATFIGSASGFRQKTISSLLAADTKNSPTIPLDPIAEIHLQKTDGTLYIVPGETITYTIPITNLGVLDARNLVISDVLDSQLTFITYTLKDKNGKIPHTSPSPVNRVYTWTLSSAYLLTPTEKLTLSIRVKVDDPLASGTNQIDNKVSLRYHEDGSTRVNKTATDFSYTPNFEIVQYSVSPTEAKINERFTFSFRVYNRQTQVPATNVVFTNTFPSYLSFYSSSPSGSYNSSSRVFSVDLGTISPNSFKDVSIIMTVNNVASSTQTLNNTATARFEHGGKKQWRSSNTVQYRILGSSTLPGTGFAPPSQSVVDYPLAFWVAVGIGFLLLGGGLLGIAYSFYNRSSEWAGWARQMGAILSLAGLLFFGAAAWLGRSPAPPLTAAILETIAPSPTETQSPQESFPPPQWWDAQHASLPDYPIPTPTINPAQATENLDDTPPTRLQIPKLGLDAIVKYVPFDGFTWLISGLQNEIAWMGSTSWPGLGGNTGLAGHVTLRNGADGPFRYLETLRKGDEIRLYTQKGLYIYRVEGTLVVKDDDFSVVQPTDQAMLTLITCTGWNSDLGHYVERLVVRASLEKSQALSGGIPGWLPFSGVWQYGGD